MYNEMETADAHRQTLIASWVTGKSQALSSMGIESNRKGHFPQEGSQLSCYAGRHLHDHPSIGTLICHLDAHFRHQCSTALSGEIAVCDISVDR